MIISTQICFLLFKKVEYGIQLRGHAAQNVQRSRFFLLHLLLLREESWDDRADADARRADGTPVATAGMFSFTTRQRRTSASALARSTIAHLGKRPNPSDPASRPAPTSNAHHGVYNSPGGNAAVVEHVQNVNPNPIGLSAPRPD